MPCIFFFVYLSNKRAERNSNPILTEYLLTYGYLFLSKAGIANYRNQRISMGFYSDVCLLFRCLCCLAVGTTEYF